VDTVTQTAETGSIYYPQVNFSPDNDPDPELRRKKNIKQAKKILKPARVVFLPFIPRWNEFGQCCVTGIRLESLGADAFNRPLLDPDTLSPVEDDRTLFSEFFVDGLTGNARAFTPLMNVDSGAPLRSSYSPELLQLYWLFTQWKEQEQLDHMAEETNSLWRRKKIKLIPMQVTKKGTSRPALVEQLAPFFDICRQNEGKGVEISQYLNPTTNEVDLTTITLDLRAMRAHEAAERLSDQPPTVE
jgi:hypothetical protein